MKKSSPCFSSASCHPLLRPTDLDSSRSEYDQLNLLNALTRIDSLDEISNRRVKRTKANPKAGEYLKRLAARLSKARKQS